MTSLYYECHITIDPVFEEDLERVRKVCAHFGFKVASLLMQKRAEDTPERSRFDTFTTGHGQELESLRERMRGCVRELRKVAVVRRYKIEDCIIDSRVNDSECLLTAGDARDAVTEEMLVAALKEADPLGQLVDWDESKDCVTRPQMRRILEAAILAAQVKP